MIVKTFTSASMAPERGRRSVSAREQQPTVVNLLRRGSARYVSLWTGGSGPLAHGLAMISFPVLLGFAGSLLDGVLGTRPLLLILLATLGVVGAFASAFYRYEARIAREESGKPWTRRSGERARLGTGSAPRAGPAIGKGGTVR
jgi:hypothetical protein